MASTYVIDAIWNMYKVLDPGGLQSEAPGVVSPRSSLTHGGTTA